MKREKLPDYVSDSLPAVRADLSVNTAEDLWSLYVPHSGHYMYHQLNIQQFYVLPTQCI